MHHDGGLTLAGCQVPTKATLSLPLLSWTGDKKSNESLVCRDQDRERSVSSYYHDQDRLDAGKINLICYQSNQSTIIRNKTKS